MPRPKDVIRGWIMAMAQGGGGPQKESNLDHAAARHQPRREGGRAQRSADRAQFALRRRLGRRHALCRRGRRNPRLSLRLGETEITAEPTVLTPLPGGPINHHWTKDLALSPDGRFSTPRSARTPTSRSAGSRPRRAGRRSGRWTAQTGAARVFASGLRNPNGLTFHPETGVLWTVVNERDELGPNLVPDYLTSVQEGGFYGWPWSYYRRPRRRAGASAAAGHGGEGDQARLRAVEPCRGARPDLLQRLGHAGALRERRLRRRARQLEPRRLQRLQGGLRAVRERHAGRHGAGRGDRLPRRRPGARPAGRRRRSTAPARCSSPTMPAIPCGGSRRPTARSRRSRSARTGLRPVLSSRLKPAALPHRQLSTPQFHRRRPKRISHRPYCLQARLTTGRHQRTRSGAKERRSRKQGSDAFDILAGRFAAQVENHRLYRRIATMDASAPISCAGRSSS